MARKKDIEFALKGEPKVQEEMFFVPKNEGEVVLNDIDSEEGPDYVIFNLIKTNRNGGLHIHGEDEVIDPVTKRPTRIRLLSGVETIWVKEQKDITEDYVRRNLRSIHFPSRQKFVSIPKWDKTAIEFARTCRHNVGAPNRKTGSRFEFFEYNPKKQAEENLKAELFEIEVITKAQNQTPEFIKKHAAYLGIPMVDSFGFPKGDAIKTDYIVFAKRNPKRFMETLDSNEIEVSYMVRKCLSEQKIDLSSRQGMAVWGGNMNPICRLIPTYDPIKQLTELALTNSNEGRDFLATLQTMVV